MTDPDTADRTYIEPITAAVCEKIIECERPQAILPTVGGQTGLNTAVELAKSGVLERYGVELIGATLDAIETAEDRELFKKAMDDIGLEMPSRLLRSLIRRSRRKTEIVGVSRDRAALVYSRGIGWGHCLQYRGVRARSTARSGFESDI